MGNDLFFGDNLKVLRQYIRDDSVDLVYLDPPFNSNASYNVLFKSPLGAGSEAQIRAFEDTWAWGDEAEATFDEISTLNAGVFGLIKALRSFLGESDVMAYLVMMAIRLVELKRVLKNTGSIYLHCDPTASHYLKILLDGIFGPQNFKNEIVWRRSNAHNKLSKQFGPIHDIILYYTKSSEMVFHPGRTPYTSGYVESEFRFEDQRGRFRLNEIMGPGTRTGDSGKPWNGYNPTERGRHWAIPSSVKEFLPDFPSDCATLSQLDYLLEKDVIVLSRSGRPKYKQYIGPGIQYQDIWSFQPGTNGILFGAEGGIDQDVKWLDSEHERLGYPTQKPIGLLRRIIETSSNPGSVILDPFCGCGTAIHAAELLDRKWIGIDIAYLAIQVIEDRLKTWLPNSQYEVQGIPKDEAAGRGLAARDPYQFQLWAVGCVGGQPRGRGADRGIDGEIVFKTGPRTYGRGIVSVKGGRHVNPDMIRALKGVVEREQADLGIFICVDEPTAQMRTEAASGGRVTLPGGSRPRIQIVTIADLISGPSLGILTELNTVTSAEEARIVSRRVPKKISPQELQKQPQFKLPLSGGMKAKAPLVAAKVDRSKPDAKTTKVQKRTA